MARKKETNTATDTTLTLGDLCAKYTAHLESGGWSPGTIFSYMMELKTAQTELGATTLVASLTAEDIARYFACDHVLKLKNGKPKAAPSYLKTQRVLRLALAFAEQTGLIAASPIPAKVHTSNAPAPEPTPTPAPKKQRKSRVVVEVVNEPQIAATPAA